MKGRARKPTVHADTRRAVLAVTRRRHPSRRTVAAGISLAPGSAFRLVADGRRESLALRLVADGGRESLVGNGGAAAQTVRNQLVPEALQARSVRSAIRAQRREISGRREAEGGEKRYVAPSAFATPLEARETQRLVGGFAPHKWMRCPCAACSAYDRGGRHKTCARAGRAAHAGVARAVFFAVVGTFLGHRDGARTRVLVRNLGSMLGPV